MEKVLCFIFVLFSASIVAAMEMPPNSTSSCHCFKDRSFDPQRKSAADQYLLTTSFNSFIGANFHISKKKIVMMKMQGGVHPDDLLIGLFVAQAANVELNSLLAILDNGGTWKQMFSSESIKSIIDNNKSLAAVRTALDTEGKAVEVVTDELLKKFFKIRNSDITALRKEGASGREITLVYLLERYGKRDIPSVDILKMHTRMNKSWGEIANFFGLTPKETGRLLKNSF
ncbi:hypothetical protein KAJ27_06040 [bacterium]|nr:hypothetical protein [bacterium]